MDHKLNSPQHTPSSPGPDYLAQWHALAAVTDFKKALYDHFLYLADSPGFAPVLAQILDQALGVQVADGCLTVQFPGGEVLSGTKPAKKIKASYPRSFQEALSRHGSLSLNQARVALEDHGLFNEDDGWFEVLEEEGSELLDHGSLSKILSPLYDYSDLWLYHPAEKNPQGEPVLYFLSHEGGDIEKPFYGNLGSLFLKRMVRSLDLSIEVPEIPGPVDSSFDYKTWWANLDPRWQQVLEASDEGIQDPEEAHKVRKLTDLQVEDDLEIPSLEPLSLMPKLQHLELPGQKIKDYSPLGNLSKLRSLELQDSDVKDLSWITSLEHLERLELDRTPVRDLSPLKVLKNLETLSLEETQVQDLAPLASLKKLRSLTINRTPVSSLKPLSRCKKLHSLNCDKTSLTFRQILEFIEERVDDADGFLGLVDVSCDFLDSFDPEVLVKALEAWESSAAGVERALTIHINNTLIQTLKHKKYLALAPRLIRAALRILSDAAIPPNLAENLAANILVCVVAGNLDETSTQKFLAHFLPEEITLAVLAYNLACYHAQKKDLVNLLKFTGLAIDLGHERARFKTDPHFSAFQTHPDFLALIQKNPFPEDPEKEPLAWWSKLPEDVKETLTWRYPMGSNPKDSDILGLITQEDFSLSFQGSKNLDFLRGLKHLRELTLRECKTSNLDFLETLTGLTYFECKKDPYLGGTQYTDISVLSRLTSLTHLDLAGHRIQDISPLKGLVPLETLNLFGNPVEDLGPLEALTQLQDLTLSPQGTQDLKSLQNLKHLTHLDLNSNNQGILKDLEGLRDLENLQRLWLHMNPPKGQKLSLTPLESLKNLRDLFLYDQALESLEPLYSLPGLTHLHISPKQVTEAQLKEFKTRCPGCRISG